MNRVVLRKGLQKLELRDDCIVIYDGEARGAVYPLDAADLAAIRVFINAVTSRGDAEGEEKQ